MPLICKCDLCGKTSEQVRFTDAPIVLPVTNYQGRKFRVHLSVTVEEDSHMTNVQNLRNIMLGRTKLKSDGDSLMNLMSLVKSVEDGEQDLPIICNQCKREHTSKIALKGSYFAGEEGKLKKIPLTDDDWNAIIDDLDNMEANGQNFNFDPDDWDE